MNGKGAQEKHKKGKVWKENDLKKEKI
jgi:hypothetical protein